MSKFIKFSAIALALVSIISFGTAKAHADTWDFGTTTLKSGSSGTFVVNLQTALNACAGANLTADGKFGPMTNAAVMAFQTAHNLTADGLVGMNTKAALNSCGAVVVTPSGALCPNGMTLASNCMTAPGAVPTVSLCPNGNTLASNCMTAPSGNVAVSGAPLSINNVSAISGYLNSSVGVGEVDSPVADVRIVTGAGGNGNLTGINVSFYNFNSATDYQFIKYASDVSIWLNGVKVGSLPVSQFAQYNSVYSAFIPVSGAVLNANSTNDLQIGVTAPPVIDSANMLTDVWGIDITSIRYSDATGSAFTYTPSNIFGNTPLSGSTIPAASNSYFSFSSAASASSIKLTVTKNVNDSTDRIAIGSSSSNTTGVTLSTLDFNAQGSAISIHRLPVSVLVGGATSSSAPSFIVNTLRLYDAAGLVSGTALDTESVPSGIGTQIVTFQNLNIVIPVNGTVTLTVKGDFNTVGGAYFVAGDYVEIDLTGANVLAIQAYDSGNNVLTGATFLTGSTTGSKVYMYVNGITVAPYGTPTTSVAPAGGAQTHSTVTYTIPFAVTAFGAVAYIPSTADATSFAYPHQKISFCVDATSICTAGGSTMTGGVGGTGIISYLGSDTLTATANGNYQIPIGQTKNFQVVITYQPNSAISTRASLMNVNWSTLDATAGYPAGYNTYAIGLNSNSFKTPYAAAQ